MSSPQSMESTSRKKPGEKGAEGSLATDPLAHLETQVRLAITEIERLRRVNGELRAELAELAAVARREGERQEEEASESAAWEDERSAIRNRVEGLVEGLEKLLEHSVLDDPDAVTEAE